MLKQDNLRPSLRFFILSHHSYNKVSHTFHVRLRERSLYLCARCTGIGVGMLSGILYVNYLAESFSHLPVLVLVFISPAIIDWLLQVFKFRESTNTRRVLTGVLVGNAYLVGIIALLRGWLTLLIDYALVFAVITVVLYVLFRTTGIMDDYLARSWPVT